MLFDYGPSYSFIYVSHRACSKVDKKRLQLSANDELRTQL